MDTVIVDDKAFLLRLEAHMDEVEALRRFTVPVPPERQKNIIDHAAELFGETLFADMAIAVVGNRDTDALEEYLRFVDAVDSTVRAKGVVGWLFRMLWDADTSVTETVRESEDNNEVASARGYLRDVCVMAATIMLQCLADKEISTRLAALLLGDRYDDVLSIWLPQADVLLDEASFQHMYEELERHRAVKTFQEGLPPRASSCHLG
ncbi:hypothetical protein [Bifidobacterium parmae]|uniref:Uncharacterized protein n=1 Tax=Bifidobacterium parmae TaxID=361854 RepID=A0A2N5J6H8_9BIFI|nr:hypothetical protein [Bifidobacterium parmae]PLS29815.1 hypothetical protein Uis4E_0156 [Bifidobacterium parmae]